MKSALYEGRVEHARVTPTPHRFGFRLWMAYLDLAEIDEVVARSRLWSRGGPTPVSFRRRDYLGDPAVPLDEAVRRRVEDATGVRPPGSIRMLGHLRTWGWCFNPITLYFCFGRGSEPSHLVVDVMNTPWHERHSYVLDWESDRSPEGSFDLRKELHVSPFLGMDLRHRIRCEAPGDRMDVTVVNDGPDADGFAARLALRRREMESREMAAVLLRHPMLTHRVSVSIHRQALALWRKRIPFRRHPRTAHR